MALPCFAALGDASTCLDGWEGTSQYYVFASVLDVKHSRRTYPHNITTRFTQTVDRKMEDALSVLSGHFRCKRFSNPLKFRRIAEWLVGNVPLYTNKDTKFEKERLINGKTEKRDVLSISLRSPFWHSHVFDSSPFQSATLIATPNQHLHLFSKWDLEAQLNRHGSERTTRSRPR